ncbi:MAG: hypothetical protein ACRC2T_09300 [Thermoguttaceae bacterium]
MVDRRTIQMILSEYPKDHQSEDVYPVSHVSGLSGAQYWKVDAPAGVFCLRRWPKGVPTVDRIQYMQAVLWYAVVEGFDLVPLPCETLKHNGYVTANGCIWEMLPWMSGAKEPRNTPLVRSKKQKTEVMRIVSAMLTLAHFHESTAEFPLPNEPVGVSEAIEQHLKKWKEWVNGRIALLLAQIRNHEREENSRLDADLIKNSLAMVGHFLALGASGLTMFNRGRRLFVPIQPSIGNADRRHLLFDHNGVCGMLDFKSLGADSVSLDIATLIGSMAGNDPDLWAAGLKAYKSVRPLSDEEMYLISAFDFAEMTLSGLALLEQIYMRKIAFRKEQLEAISSIISWQVQRLNDYRFGKN